MKLAQLGDRKLMRGIARTPEVSGSILTTQVVDERRDGKIRTKNFTNQSGIRRTFKAGRMGV